MDKSAKNLWAKFNQVSNFKYPSAAADHNLQSHK